MITLELSRKNYNTQYLQYNPEKYIINFDFGGNNDIRIRGWDITRNELKWRHTIWADSVSTRNSLIPKYIRKEEIIIWD